MRYVNYLVLLLKVFGFRTELFMIAFYPMSLGLNLHIDRMLELTLDTLTNV